MHTKERQVTTRSSDGREKLAVYIYEYLVHIGARKAAQTFLSEIKWEKDIALGDPPGFLHSWWAIFWDLYCAAPERREIYRSSSEAKAYYDYGFVNNYSSGPHNAEPTNCRSTNTTEGAQMGPMPPTFASNPPMRPPTLGPPRQPYPPAKTMRSPPFQGQFYPINQRPILRRPRMGAEYNNSNQPSQSFQAMMSPKNYSDFNRPGPSGMSSRVGIPFNPSYVPNSRGPPPYSANVYPGPSGLNSGGPQQYQGSPGAPYYVPPRTYSGAPRPPRPSLSTLPIPQDLTLSGSDSVFTPMRPVRDPNRTEEFLNSPVYESSSVEQAKTSMADDCLGNEKSSPLSETNSPKDDNNRLSDFSMTDYRRYLETDHSDSVAIMKIKESMQEEAKKFEKDSDSMTFVELQ